MVQDISPFLRFLINKIREDRIGLNAAALSYLTILSLVPLLAVTVSIFSAFPVFEKLSIQIETFIFTNFVPAAGEQVQQALQQFVSNASRMTVVGLAFLIITAMLLVAVIDQTINEIWHTSRQRKFHRIFPVYWSVLTLGPLLIGAGLMASSYLLTFTEGAVPAPAQLQGSLIKILPYLTSATAFLLIYHLVPAHPVRLRHAFYGATAAAILFEVSKKVFALYIANFPAYQTIYGALAAVPILLVWIYISWIVVLLGAEFTYCLGHFQQSSDQE